jgi:hypothetical protein
MSHENELPISRTETANSKNNEVSMAARSHADLNPESVKGMSTAIDMPTVSNEKVDDICVDDDDEVDTKPGYIQKFYRRYIMFFQ